MERHVLLASPASGSTLWRDRRSRSTEKMRQGMSAKRKGTSSIPWRGGCLSAQNPPDRERSSPAHGVCLCAVCRSGCCHFEASRSRNAVFVNKQSYYTRKAIAYTHLLRRNLMQNQ